MYSPQQFQRWWSQSLGAIGGVPPIDYGTYTTTSLKLRSKHFPALLTPEFSRTRRDKLVQKALKSEKIARLRSGLDRHCPLCRNIARAESDRYLALEVAQNSLILPNRYPSQAGASLLLSVNHQAPCSGSATEHLALLKAAAEACRRFGVIAVKNHPRDGMSLPKHDHIHLWPRELATSKHVLDLIASAGEQDVSALAASPFDSRVVRGANSLELTAQIFAAFDRAGIIYTYAQDGQTVMISPRVSSGSDVLISLTGPLHIFSPPYSSAMMAALSFVPLVGCFAWEKFVPKERSRPLPWAA